MLKFDASLMAGMSRLTTALLGIGFAVVTGCSTPSPSAKANQQFEQSPAASGLNGSRAFLPLAMIQPSVGNPPRSETLDWKLSDRALEQLAKADRLVAGQRHAEAAIALERALSFAPRHPVIHCKLAELHLEAGNPARARIHADEALRSNPDSVKANYLKGVVEIKAGHESLGESWLRTGYLLDPAFVPIRVALARLYVDSYRYEDAIKVASRVRDDAVEDVRLEVVLGDIYERLDDYEGAELHYRAAVLADRGSAAAMLGLARVYLYKGEVGGAQQQLRALIDLDPANEPAREALAEIHLRDNKPDEALALYRQLQSLTDSPLTAARLKALLDQVDNPDAQLFREALLDAMGEHGEDAATWVALAGSYTQFEPEKAIEGYQKALLLDSGNEDALLGAARTQRLLLNYEEVIALWQVLIKRRPNHHAWHLERIRTLVIIQNYDGAVEAAIAGESNTAAGDVYRRRYRAVMIDAFVRGGRLDDAIEHAGRWADEDRTDQYWPSYLARLYLQRDNPERAIKVLERICQIAPLNLVALGDLTRALADAKKPERACQLALSRLNDDPANDELLAILISTLEVADRRDDAIELVNSKLRSTRNVAGFEMILLQLMAGAERHDECVKLLERMIDEQAILGERARHDPHDLRLWLIEQLMAAEDYAEAERRLTSYLTRAGAPEARFGYLYQLAFCWEVRGNSELAAEAKERALALRPGNVYLNNDVAYSWIDRGIQLDEAERMIRLVVASAPGQGAYLDTYGWLMYKRGRFIEARKWLERACGAMTEVDPVVLDHLGDTCWRLGDRENAVKFWASAVEVLRERDERLLSADEKRVSTVTAGKIAEAQSEGEPSVAPLGKSGLRDEQPD